MELKLMTAFAYGHYEYSEHYEGGKGGATFHETIAIRYFPDLLEGHLNIAVNVLVAPPIETLVFDKSKLEILHEGLIIGSSEREWDTSVQPKFTHPLGTVLTWLQDTDFSLKEPGIVSMRFLLKHKDEVDFTVV